MCIICEVEQGFETKSMGGHLNLEWSIKPTGYSDGNIDLSVMEQKQA